MADYFADIDVVDAMTHEHMPLWLEIVRILRGDLVAGCRIADFGCSSGALLRLLYSGLRGSLDPIQPAVAVGIENVGMRAVLRQAVSLTPPHLPILFTDAQLHSFVQQFDVIISHEVAYLIEDLSALGRTMYEALRPGGVACIATMGYVENDYYRRWLPTFHMRGIPAFTHSKHDYVAALEGAGFAAVNAVGLSLSPQTYQLWRSDGRGPGEWFESRADERVYFTEVGKLAFLARR